MTREQKDLLIKDLCARLPYKPIVHIHDLDVMDYDNYLYPDYIEKMMSDSIKLKPYLRPLSSMTPEEKKYIKYKWGYSDWDTLNDFLNYTLIDTCDAESFIDWLNSKHFDYRGLIEKGLAIEAPEGMYNFN